MSDPYRVAGDGTLFRFRWVRRKVWWRVPRKLFLYETGEKHLVFTNRKQLWWGEDLDNLWGKLPRGHDDLVKRWVIDHWAEPLVVNL